MKCNIRLVTDDPTIMGSRVRIQETAVVDPPWRCPPTRSYLGMPPAKRVPPFISFFHPVSSRP